MNDYWTECVAEALSEAGVTATQEQILVMAEIIEGAHEMYGESTGITYNPILDELRNTRIALEKEKNKSVCNLCRGTGRYDPRDGFGEQTCYKCNGDGMILTQSAAYIAEIDVRKNWEYSS